MPRAAPPPASSCSPPPTAPGARVSATRGRREQTHRLRAASASAGGGDARQHVQQCSAHAHVAHTRTPAQEGVNRAALLWRCSIFDVRVENMCVLKVRARLPRSILLKRRPLSSHKVRHTALPLRRDRTTATPSAAPRSAPASAAPASTLLHLSKQPPTRPRRLRPSVPRLRASASATSWPALQSLRLGTSDARPLRRTCLCAVQVGHHSGAPRVEGAALGLGASVQTACIERFEKLERDGGGGRSRSLGHWLTAL